MKDILQELNKIRLKEEVKARQRSIDRDILECDRDTKYFHKVANQRRRKTMIHSLDGPNGPTYDIKEMIDVASNFYRDLYKKEDRKGFSLSDDFFSEGEKVTGNDNISLESPFTEDEVNNPVFGSYSNGVPGPDGLSFLFYQYFW